MDDAPYPPAEAASPLPVQPLFRHQTLVCRSGRRVLMVGESFVTQRVAAELADCSKDTIIRARRAGRFPHATLRSGAWMIPVDDLIAAGLYDPVAPSGGTPPTTRDGDTAGTVVELARALTRVAALEEVVVRQDEELRFLRQLMTESVGKAGAHS